MDYAKTLNLPRTKFPMRANLPKLEPEILKKWEKLSIYSKVISKNKTNPEYILHDGPPYANGHIHIGHALNKILKDIIVRYKNMNGFNALFIPGWDCHGLPVEHQLFKELNIKKEQIGKIEFRKKAKDYALKFVNLQKEEFKRLGVFGLWDKAYLTLNPEYEAGVIRTFGKLVRNRFIYRSLKPVNWCINCETALAEAEVEYELRQSPSIYVKFPLLNEKNVKLATCSLQPVYFLVWTTTPWTLTANVAVALNPDAEYVLVETYLGEQKQFIIVVKNLLAHISQKLKIKNYRVVKTILGKHLAGLTLSHPFINRSSKIVLSELVSIQEGTGCVHIAPGHGEEDYQIGLKCKLPTIMPLDSRGKFIKNKTQYDLPGWLDGEDISHANELIIEKLLERKFLVFKEEIQHSYPHCWRCKKPVIFRAVSQWFMNIDNLALRQRCLENIKKVKWFPVSSLERIKDMINLRPDWCLSRQRYWGVPIPALFCNHCNNSILDCKIIERIAGLIEKEGSDIWFNLELSQILPDGIKCHNCGGNVFKKGEDIIDVWFESGVSHFSVLMSQKHNLKFPAELYLEGNDQHRGWFQASLITSVAVNNRTPFEAVLTHGFVVDAQGRKMSKSKGNVVDPQDVIKELGADVLRMWVISCNYYQDVRISPQILGNVVDTYRKIRNTFKFLLGNLYDFNPKQDRLNFDELDLIDKWALSKLTRLLQQIIIAYKNFDFYQIYRNMYDFYTVDMSSFYLDILKDRLYTFSPDSHLRLSSQTALYEILKILVNIMAPILPFTCEQVFEFMPRDEECERVISVHLLNFPKVKTDWIDEDLENEFTILMNVRDIILKKLETKRIERLIGSSLEAEVNLYIFIPNLSNLLEKYKDDLETLLIVSKVNLVRKLGNGKKTRLSDEIKLINYKNLSSELIVEINKAKGSKCLRCWNWREEIGKDPGYPDICDRCKKVMEELTRRKKHE